MLRLLPYFILFVFIIILGGNSSTLLVEVPNSRWHILKLHLKKKLLLHPRDYYLHFVEQRRYCWLDHLKSGVNFTSAK